MKNVRTLAALNFLSYLIHILFASLTQFKLVNVENVAQVSAKYPTLITPAPVTFAVWGIIYAYLGVFCIYHLAMAFLKPARHPANIDTQRIDGWFVIANMASAAWLVAWTWDEIGIALSFIVVQLIALIAMNVKLGIIDTDSSRTAKLFTQIPLSIYFGWITFATVANAAAYLVANDWDGLGLVYTSAQWTIIIIAATVLITALVVSTRRNIWFGAVVMWGLLGVVLNLNSTDAYGYSAIIHTAWAGIAIIAATCVLRGIINVTARKSHENIPWATHH